MLFYLGHKFGFWKKSLNSLYLNYSSVKHKTNFDIWDWPAWKMFLDLKYYESDFVLVH